MLTIPETCDVQDKNALAKTHKLSDPLSFVVQGMLAGAFVGIAVVFMVSASGPLLAAGSGWVKLVNGAVFGIALMLVVAAGGELVTSSMMTLTQGWARRVITGGQWALTLLATFAANLLGAWLFSAVVHASGLVKVSQPAGAMLANMLESKAHESSVELFARGILCNVLVCLAIWAATRMNSEIAKLTIIYWCIFAFITSGFEHVVANMTTFGLGIFGGLPGAGWDDFARNMVCVGLGNLVGGVIVGLAYVSYQRKNTR